jgi:replicative DNA helicase
MTLYHSLLKAFLDPQLYHKYKDVLDGPFIKENYPELFKLFQCLAELHSKTPNDKAFSIEDLEIALETYYPNSDRASYQPIFRALQETTFAPNSIHQYLQQTKERKYASDLAHAALAVAEGREKWSAITQVIDNAETDITEQILTDQLGDFENDDLNFLAKTQHDTPGLRWRLDSLNTSLGSLRKGDFGFLFARPETGKTTFLSSEIAFMAGQTDRPIIWFDNEEQGGKVLLRCYQAALGLPLHQLLANRDTYNAKYKELTKSNIKLLYDPNLTKAKVESVCKEYNPALIIFDQIDHIQGFEDARNDIELKNKYTWGRGIAGLYGPVIAVCQAGSTGDGKRWLTMNDVDNSKTGKQGAADWILGIGKDYDEGHEFVRYLYLSKNKLLGDKDTLPNRRHDRWEVKICPEIARYEDF